MSSPGITVGAGDGSGESHPCWEEGEEGLASPG